MTKRYFTPFGEKREGGTGTWSDDKFFLGMTADDETGLTHVGAREYDPSTGRFISVDSVLVLDQHQSLNGYSYSGNNPITYSDLTGLCFADVCGIGTPKGDGSGEIIQDGPIDPGNPGGGSCHNGSCSSGTAASGGGGNGGGGSLLGCGCGLAGPALGGDPFYNPIFADDEAVRDYVSQQNQNHTLGNFLFGMAAPFQSSLT